MFTFLFYLIMVPTYSSNAGCYLGTSGGEWWRENFKSDAS